MQMRKANWKSIRNQVPCAFCSGEHATKECPHWSKRLKNRHPKEKEGFRRGD